MTTTTTLPAEVISIVFDHLWAKIILHMNTTLFLNMLLINKTFHKIVGRRRPELMQAHALLLNTSLSPVVLRRFKVPLSNPHVNPCAYLFGLCHELRLGPPAEDLPKLVSCIANFVLTNNERFDSLISTTEPPFVFLSKHGTFGATGHVKELKQVPEHLSHGPESFLLKNVVFLHTSTVSQTWPYAVMIYSDSPDMVYAFRRRDNGTVETNLCRIDKCNDALDKVMAQNSR
ncbi:hypothetical protein DFJ77DRAFT_291982 [Powellomyces hirtus]|nr:hypothetical protein DFJ77DRAFT_291982 [Powellomyces hirtus]